MKKITDYFAIFVLIYVCMPFLAAAQLDNEPRNLPKYDENIIHFGFSLGFNSSTFSVNRVGNLKIRDTVYSVEPSAIAGLNLGILSDLRIGAHFNLRFIPTLSFGQRNLTYHFIYNDSSEANTVKTIESTYLEFPLILKFKSQRVNNYRIYVLAGAKYSIDMVSQAKVKNKEKDIIKLRRYDYGYEVGIGFDFYLDYFKFSPEIKMFNGLNNLLQPDGTQFSSPLEGLYAKTFIVSLLFE